MVRLTDLEEVGSSSEVTILYFFFFLFAAVKIAQNFYNESLGMGDYTVSLLLYI